MLVTFVVSRRNSYAIVGRIAERPIGEKTMCLLFVAGYGDLATVCGTWRLWPVSPSLESENSFLHGSLLGAQIYGHFFLLLL